MDVQCLEEDVWLMVLPGEPQLCPELALLRKRIADAGRVDLILDLSHVEIIGSPSLGILLALHRLLSPRGGRLVLCRARLATKCIFRTAGLETFFDFVGDRYEAMNLLRQSPGSAVESLPESDRDP